MNIEAISAMVTTVAVVAGGAWALFQWRDNLALRKREFRWKQAEAAHKLIDQVFEDEDTGDALRMIDGEKDEYEIASGKSVSINVEQIRIALGFDSEPDATNAFIRHRFDSFLYNLERLEHALEVGLVDFSDITTPTAYYVKCLAPYRDRLTSYAETIGYNRALRFLGRFREWTESPPSKATQSDAASPRC